MRVEFLSCEVSMAIQAHVGHTLLIVKFRVLLQNLKSKYFVAYYRGVYFFLNLPPHKNCRVLFAEMGGKIYFTGGVIHKKKTLHL